MGFAQTCLALEEHAPAGRREGVGIVPALLQCPPHHVPGRGFRSGQRLCRIVVQRKARKGDVIGIGSVGEPLQHQPRQKILQAVAHLPVRIAGILAVFTGEVHLVIILRQTSLPEQLPLMLLHIQIGVPQTGQLLLHIHSGQYSPGNGGTGAGQLPAQFLHCRSLLPDHLQPVLIVVPGLAASFCQGFKRLVHYLLGICHGSSPPHRFIKSASTRSSISWML